MSKEAQERYDARMAYKVGLKLNRKTDADLIATLEATPNKQALIKDALRGYIERSTEMKMIEIYADGTQRTTHNVTTDAITAMINLAKEWNRRLPEGEHSLTEIRIIMEESNEGE